MARETQRTVVYARRFSSEPQPANGWSLCLHHQTIKVLYSTDHQEGRSVDCCRVAGFLCAAPATVPHLFKERSSGFTCSIRIFRYHRVRDFANARFTVFGRTYFHDRSTPRATNERSNETGAFQSTGWARLRNVFAQSENCYDEIYLWCGCSFWILLSLWNHCDSVPTDHRTLCRKSEDPHIWACIRTARHCELGH